MELASTTAVYLPSSLRLDISLHYTDFLFHFPFFCVDFFHSPYYRERGMMGDVCDEDSDVICVCVPVCQIRGGC